jgi:hypothetical protein
MHPLLTRIDTEVAAGRAWRAKEIVGSSLSQAWPHPEVVERYGQLLLSLGDEMEAGKYLWLSGVRTAAHEPAIALFLRRHGRHGRAALLGQLPKSFRRLAFNQLPTELRRELSSLGIREGDFGKNARTRPVVIGRSRWMRRIAATFVLGFLICVIVGAGVGFRAIIRWLAEAFR